MMFDDRYLKIIHGSKKFSDTHHAEIRMPYLGPVVGKYSDWTSLFDREKLFTRISTSLLV